MVEQIEHWYTVITVGLLAFRPVVVLLRNAADKALEIARGTESEVDDQVAGFAVSALALVANTLDFVARVTPRVTTGAAGERS